MASKPQPQRLWQAEPYDHPISGRPCVGKVHILRDEDATRTRCGLYVAVVGGTALDAYGTDGSNCKGCKTSVVAQQARATRSAEWNAQSVVARAEAERARAEWWQRYNHYLTTPGWRERRMRVLARANNRCEGCGFRAATQVHHLTYERVGREMLFDLVAICENCHDLIHAGPL